MDILFRVIQRSLPLLLLLSVLLYVLRQSRGRVRNIEDGPLLASSEMLGSTDLQSMAKGIIEGFPYNLLTNDSGRVMFFVELGHNSWSHIVAYGDKSEGLGADHIVIAGRWLEPAVLEGDFPDYFHMYCNPEAQDTVREVFTPDVMELFANFCRTYDFELFHDGFYISQAQHAHDATDTTTLTSDLTDFLRRAHSELSRL